MIFSRELLLLLYALAQNLLTKIWLLYLKKHLIVFSELFPYGQFAFAICLSLKFKLFRSNIFVPNLAGCLKFFVDIKIQSSKMRLKKVQDTTK